MPRYARRRINRRRRPIRRRKAVRRYRRKMPLYKLPTGGFGNRKLARLRFVQDFTLNPDVGALATHYFKCNGCYDPDLTTLGNHQPRGFDQNMLAYEHFTVIGAKITVSVVPEVSGQVGNTQTPFMWGVAITPTPALGTGMLNTCQVLESNLAGKQYRMAGQNTAAGSAVNAPMMTRRFSSKKYFGKSSLVGYGQFSGSAAADPNELAYFCIWGGPIGGAAVDPDGQHMLAQIEYIVVFSERKFLEES